MNFFEREMRMMFSDNDIIHDVKFCGKTMLGKIDDDLRVKLEFISTYIASQYDAVRATIINRSEGVVDLFHGTTTEALRDIMNSGAILRMSRHAVHMQEDVNKAWQSAERRKNKTPVVLKIAARRMSQNGFVFSISENDVWFCEWVPTEYIAEFLYTKEHK